MADAMFEQAVRNGGDKTGERMTQTIEGREVTFYTVNTPLGQRWAFVGSRFAMGYLTQVDARAEAEAQIQGRYRGPLNNGVQVKARIHSVTAKALSALSGRMA